jgi:hypothetical protein
MKYLEHNCYLSDVQVAEALAERGVPISAATLKSHVTRGGGPAYRKFGRRRLYQLKDVLSWLDSKLSSPQHSSSERYTHGPSASPFVA